MPWDPLLRGVRQTCATRWPGVSMTVGLGRPLRPRAFAALVGLPPCCLLWREATPVPCSSFLRPSFCLSRFSLSTVLLLRSTRLHFLFASPRLADLLRRRRVHASGNGVCAFGRCCWLRSVVAFLGSCSFPLVPLRNASCLPRYSSSCVLHVQPSFFPCCPAPVIAPFCRLH